MGLWDSVLAGVGQGLEGGVSAYNKQLQANQQMDEHRQQMANEARQNANQQTLFGQQQAGLGLAGTQAAYIAARNSHDYAGQQAAANAITPLYNANNNTHLPIPADVIGTPVGDQPAQPARGLSQYGPAATYSPLTGYGPTSTGSVDSPATPFIAAHNDLSNPQSQAAMDQRSHIGPQIRTVKNGEEDYLFNPLQPGNNRLIASNQQHLSPEMQMLKDQLDNKTKAGIGAGHDEARMYGSDTSEINNKNTVDGANTRNIRTVTGATVRAGIASAARSQQVGDKEGWRQASVVGGYGNALVAEFPGAHITSSYRPLGKPSDPAGMDTQWGQENRGIQLYPDLAERRQFYAAPGNSGHGTGATIDIAGVAPADRARFIQRAQFYGFNPPYDESGSKGGAHDHLDYVGPMTPYRAPKAGKTAMDYGADGTATVVNAQPGTVVHTRPATPKDVDPAVAWKNLSEAVLSTPGLQPTALEKMSGKQDPELQKLREAKRQELQQARQTSRNKRPGANPNPPAGNALDRLNQAIDADRAARQPQAAP